MSNEPHLPGYSLDDDDPHNEPVSPSHPPAAASEHADDLVLTTSAGDADAAAAPRVSTEPTSTTTTHWQERQQPENLDAAPPALPERPPAVDEFADPKIAPLHAIFPDFDAAILHSVVDSVGGDQDRAVDALLAMSDPDHVPASGGGPQAEPSATEQTQLDEEFARQLMLEDEQRYARDQIALRQQQQQQQTRQFPYAPRAGAHAPQLPTAAGAGGATAPQQQDAQRDTMTDVQEQFSKFAETGKRTLSSFVSKVKAKVQEFDQSRNTQAQNPSSYTYTGSGSGSVSPPPSSSDGGLDRHAQQAYHAASTNPDPSRGHAGATTNERNALDPPSSLPASTVPRSVTVVHDDDDDNSTAAFSPPPATRTGPPPNIDPGKIGLLPKRQVSLVNTQSQPSRAPDEEDEDDLEYVENPFEEGRYS